MDINSTPVPGWKKIIQRLNRARLDLPYNAHRLMTWIRFGTITESVKATAGDHVVAEVEYRGRGGKIVGYWAYGYWDPRFPYKG